MQTKLLPLHKIIYLINIRLFTKLQALAVRAFPAAKRCSSGTEPADGADHARRAPSARPSYPPAGHFSHTHIAVQGPCSDLTVVVAPITGSYTGNKTAFLLERALSSFLFSTMKCRWAATLPVMLVFGRKPSLGPSHMALLCLWKLRLPRAASFNPCST